MITTGAKLWFAIASAALFGMVAYFVATGRGEDGGTMVLGSIAAACAVLAVASLVSRDGDVTVDPDAEVEEVRIRSSLPAFWPMLGAVGAGVAIIGLASGGLLLYVGIGIVSAVIVEWMVQAWAERSTADPAYNQALRNRMMFPVEVPVLGIAGLVLVMITFSRVLLAVSKTGSTVVAIAVATIILGVGSIVATRPKIPAGALAWVVAIGAVGLLAAGVAGGIAGERDIEEHHADEVDHPVEGEGDVPEGAGDEAEPAEEGADDNTEVSTP